MFFPHVKFFQVMIISAFYNAVIASGYFCTISASYVANSRFDSTRFQHSKF